MMDLKLQLAGMDRFLSAVFEEETNLGNLQRGLGFEQAQIDLLQGSNLETLLSQFVEAIHKRLTGESGKDDYFHLLNQRFGLDGGSPIPIEAIAARLNTSPEYARRLGEDVLEKCRTRTFQEDLKKSLRIITLDGLGKVVGRPAKEHVAGKLERLSNLRTAADLAHMDYDARRAEILKQVQSELDALDAEYNPLFETAGENITNLEAEIKNDVLLYGESVQAGTYRAVYVQGRVSWDNQGMNRYASSHPDILQFRKQGQPSVTLRTVEEKKHSSQDQDQS